jgi:hypothetical protein
MDAEDAREWVRGARRRLRSGCSSSEERYRCALLGALLAIDSHLDAVLRQLLEDGGGLR